MGNSLVSGLRAHQTSADAVKAGLFDVASCLLLLKDCPLPYTFLAHIHGQRSVEMRFRSDNGKSPLTVIADDVASEVASISKM